MDTSEHILDFYWRVIAFTPLPLGGTVKKLYKIHIFSYVHILIWDISFTNIILVFQFELLLMAKFQSLKKLRF